MPDMKNVFQSLVSFSLISRYRDLDHLRYQILRYVFICTIIFIGCSIFYNFTILDNASKFLTIGIPIVSVSLLGLFILPRLKLDSTVSITFTLMYMGIYVAGYLQVLNPGYVIFILNMILILMLFFIRYRTAVLVACLVGVSANILIILPTSIFLHEYLIGSVAFLSFFYAISTLIYKYQERLIKENKNIESKNLEIQLLLKEIHHRVKNNLQTISSILYLQSIKMKDVEAKEAIKKGQYRIESMALIHKNLYQRSNLAGIEMKEYIKSLVDNLKQVHGGDKDVDIVIKMESVELDVDTAIPIGLILNELLTNAFEFAFVNRDKGEIIISMTKNLSEQYVIEIQDNGVGNNSAKNIFGNKLVQLLTKQIHATFKEENHKGFWCQLILN